jgi:hypothetical protein
LRHRLAKYHNQLEEIAGKVGAGDAYFDIKRQVHWAIGFEYSWLKAECDRQNERLRTQQWR